MKGGKEEKRLSIWERYMTREIGIEFKSCLYFSVILFFYCVYRWVIGQQEVSIIHLLEMILVAYVIGYVQVLLLWNFDEADVIGFKEIIGIIIGSVLYTGIAYIAKWFERDLFVYGIFWIYMIITYICAVFVYKEKRRIDDKALNNSLQMFQTRKDR